MTRSLAGSARRWRDRIGGRHGARTDGAGLCFCTLAISEPYRTWARTLARDIDRFVGGAKLVVLTDAPHEFAEYRNVHAVAHVPTGPMAADYLCDPHLSHGGGSANHDKRFALAAALGLARTAVFLDADSRITASLAVPAFRRGLAVGHSPRETILEHLSGAGQSGCPPSSTLRASSATRGSSHAPCGARSRCLR